VNRQFKNLITEALFNAVHLKYDAFTAPLHQINVVVAIRLQNVKYNCSARNCKPHAPAEKPPWTQRSAHWERE
jgi:hypothetical protein